MVEATRIHRWTDNGEAGGEEGGEGEREGGKEGGRAGKMHQSILLFRL